MIKVINTNAEYETYSQDGLKSGETVFVKENESVHFLTNNITGQTQTINAYIGGGQSVQADWNEDDSTAPDYIKNKPTNVSDFTNDAGYVASTTTGLKIEVVSSMPESPENDTIYFVKNNN